MTDLIPVITIDGPAGAGKGTIAAMLAAELGWHLLDSGAIYRVAAFAAINRSLTPSEPEAIVAMLRDLDIEFRDGRVFCEQQDISLSIRNPACADITSKIAAIPMIRAALLERQKAFRRLPGLVADGRDMGTVVFPDATLKIFLTASPEVRGERRYKQLSEQGISATLAALIQEIAARDKRDAERAIAPLRPADDAVCIDSSSLTPEQVLAVINNYR